MLENALEASNENCLPENLMEWRLEEKKEIVKRNLQSIISSLIDNPQNPTYVFGGMSSNAKRKIWGIINDKNANNDKLDKLITAIAQAFTYKELNQGVYNAQLPQISIVKRKTKRAPIDGLFQIIGNTEK